MEFRTKRRYSTNMMLCKLLDERVADELATLCDLFFSEAVCRLVLICLNCLVIVFATMLW